MGAVGSAGGVLPPAGLACGSSVSSKSHRENVIAPEGNLLPRTALAVGRPGAEVTQSAVGGVQECVPTRGRSQLLRPAWGGSPSSLASRLPGVSGQGAAPAPLLPTPPQPLLARRVLGSPAPHLRRHLPLRLQQRCWRPGRAGHVAAGHAVRGTAHSADSAGRAQQGGTSPADSWPLGATHPLFLCSPGVCGPAQPAGGGACFVLEQGRLGGSGHPQECCPRALGLGLGFSAGG